MHLNSSPAPFALTFFKNRFNQLVIFKVFRLPVLSFKPFVVTGPRDPGDPAEQLGINSKLFDYGELLAGP